MARRVIQPPGGTSSIFFGNDERAPAKKVEPKPASQNETSNGNIQAETKSELQPDDKVVKSNGASSESNEQASKTKASNSIDVKQESAQEAAVGNKARQGTHGYNLITGELDKPATAKQPAPSKSGNTEDQEGGSGKQPPATSIKVHHPPGGKSSGPLWSQF